MTKVMRKEARHTHLELKDFALFPFSGQKDGAVGRG